MKIARPTPKPIVPSPLRLQVLGFVVVISVVGLVLVRLCGAGNVVGEVVPLRY